MKKTVRKFLMVALGFTLVLGNVISAHAVENKEYSQNVNTLEGVYKIVAPEEDAVLIGTDTYFQNGYKITTTTYHLSDGSIVTDTINESNRNTRSRNGSDVVTRSKTVKGWGTLTVTANFDWYTQIPFSYVRCSGMSSSFVADRTYGDVKLTEPINQSYTSNYLSIGKAYATASCNLSRHYLPSTELRNISLTIECTDEGTVSDR